MAGRTVAGMEETAAVIVEEATIGERDTAQFVVFSLAYEEYGVGILSVKEIVKTGPITIIPNSPDFVKGVINLRSKIVGVIDLEKRFLIKREDEEHIGKHIVIAEIGDDTFGLLVDEVTDVIKLPKESIKSPPEMITKKIGIEYVKGIGTIGDKPIVLLDLKKVLSQRELIQLAKTSAREHRKIRLKKKETSKEEQAEEAIGGKQERETRREMRVRRDESLEEKGTMEFQRQEEKPPKETRASGRKTDGIR